MEKRMTRIAFVIALLGSLITSAAQADDVALQRLSAYLGIDTVNPPGNETRGVEYLAGILEEAGISYETAESAPGRGNLWARLEGGDEPALLLLHHIDVVPASPEFWDTDPLVPEVRDGLLFGRGALDTKALGIAHLQAFLALGICCCTPWMMTLLMPALRLLCSSIIEPDRSTMMRTSA